MLDFLAIIVIAVGIVLIVFPSLSWYTSLLAFFPFLQKIWGVKKEEFATLWRITGIFFLFLGLLFLTVPFLGITTTYYGGNIYFNEEAQIPIMVLTAVFLWALLKKIIGLHFSRKIPLGVIIIEIAFLIWIAPVLLGKTAQDLAMFLFVLMFTILEILALAYNELKSSKN